MNIEQEFKEWISSETNPIRGMKDDDHPLPITFEAGWRAALSQPQGEPVAWVLLDCVTLKPCRVTLDIDDIRNHRPAHVVELFAAPPAPIALSDEEIFELLSEHTTFDRQFPDMEQCMNKYGQIVNSKRFLAFARAILAAPEAK